MNSAYYNGSSLSWRLERYLDLVLCLCGTKHKSLWCNTGVWSFEYITNGLGSQQLMIFFL